MSLSKKTDVQWRRQPYNPWQYQVVRRKLHGQLWDMMPRTWALEHLSFFFFSLTAPCNVWDLSSPARDETCAPAVEAQNPNQLCLLLLIIGLTDFPGSSDGRVCLQCGRPGLGRSPGEENGNTLQYACLENSMDRGAWQTIVHRGCKETQLSYWHFLSDILSEDFLSPSQPEFQDIKF